MKRFAFLLLMLMSVSFANVQAGGAGTTAGLTLYRISGARASALGEAFTAMNDDITALEFNPGSLATLESSEVSLQHQTGLADDSFSKALLGLKLGQGAIGVAAGRYDSGRAELFDGVNQWSGTPEEDWTGTVGYGRSFGRVAAGASVRYLSSRLAETYSASAASIEAGAQVPLLEHLRVGVSGPIVQTKLSYANVSESLPKVYRVGLGSDLNMNLATGRLPFTLLLDVPYDADARQASVAGGAEIKMGPVALRAGYHSGVEANNFSLGAGFATSKIALDYSFGMVDSGFDSLHRVSFSMRFGK